jgi:putative transposase
MEIRKEMPRLGTRKLYELLHKDKIKVGRDELFNILRDNNLLVKRIKHRIITTNSKHWLKKYPNLIKGIEVIKPNKLYVGDITYVGVGKSHAYLFLLTDAYSHKIVGHCLSQSLEAEGGIEALKMALSAIAKKDRAGIIHHSDRGVQYCSLKYTKLLQQNQIQISMTQNGDPYDNAIAERVNGILKVEWIYHEHYESLEEAKKRIAEIIDIYNTKRPHLSCEMLTPQEAHTKEGKLKKRWKNYYMENFLKARFSKASNECMIEKAEAITPAHAIVSDYSLIGCSSAELISASSDYANLKKV